MSAHPWSEEIEPVKTDLTLTDVNQALVYHLPGRSVVEIEDRGVWLRHNYRVTLDGGEIVYLKVDEDFPASEKEAHICELLRSHGLPAPQILVVDASKSLLPSPFVIQSHVGGERLSALLDRGDPDELPAIYAALGRFYRKLHSIHHEHSGWIDTAGEVLTHSPTRHQFNEVIVRIGGEAVARGLLSAETHQRLQWLWSENLEWLDEHEPSLVGGTLPWGVYLERRGSWHVTKTMDLSDFLFWDPAQDLAIVKYPSFQPPTPLALWDAFMAEYDVSGVVDLKDVARRARLYLLVQRLDAAMGNYMEPPSPVHEQWKAQVWERFDSLLDEAEGAPA